MKKTLLCGVLGSVLSIPVYADNNLPAAAATTGTPTTPVVQPVIQQPAEIKPPVINCEYKIPADVKTVDNNLILSWSEKATMQAFDFEFKSLDTQMKALQSCFTEQGWQSFSDALQKSGNVEAIKSQQLTVSAQVEGHAQLLENKDNQWKVTLPLQVVYQNGKEKLTQDLVVKLTVAKKSSGGLGITQLIATPRQQPLPETAPH